MRAAAISKSKYKEGSSEPFSMALIWERLLLYTSQASLSWLKCGFCKRLKYLTFWPRIFFFLKMWYVARIRFLTGISKHFKTFGTTLSPFYMSHNTSCGSCTVFLTERPQKRKMPESKWRGRIGFLGQTPHSLTAFHFGHYYFIAKLSTCQGK